MVLQTKNTKIIQNTEKLKLAFTKILSQNSGKNGKRKKMYKRLRNSSNIFYFRLKFKTIPSI